jgi:hypothetical protein
MSRKKGLETVAFMIPYISRTPRPAKKNENIMSITARKIPATKLPNNRERTMVSRYLHQLFFPAAALSKNGMPDMGFTPNPR